MRVLALMALAAATGCGGADDPLAGVPAEHNPLGLRAARARGGVALPLPCSAFERPDATTATGVRLDFALGSLPVNDDGVAIAPDFANRRDGFSTAAPIVVTFPGGVSPTRLAPITDPAASLADGSPTVIVDMETGARVAHFAEVDAAASSWIDEQALILRPLARLRPARRYAVGIRSSLTTADGTPLPVPPGFRALRDGVASTHERLERMRPGFPAVLAALAAAGVPQDDLVLAWDFTTASDEMVRGDMLAGRDEVLAAMDAPDAAFAFAVEADDLPADWDPAVTLRRVRGSFDMPLLLDEDGGELSRLARDADGRPQVVGTYAAPFTAIVPACAATAELPLPVVLYGHGILGSINEAESEVIRKAAEYLCMVVVATDLRGMSERDIPQVILALGDVNRLPLVMEKLVQGVASFVALERMVRGPMAVSDVFQQGGRPLLDPTRVHYYGNSQGGIFGGSIVAYDPFIRRAVLGVSGSNYAMLLERADSWSAYSLIIGGAYESFLDRQELLQLLEMGFEMTEPVLVADGLLGVNGEPVPGTEPKQILLQAAVGDSAVNNLGTEYEARQMGLPVLAPELYLPYGLQAAAGPLASALAMWNQHPDPMPPLENLPAPSSAAHEGVRRLVTANEQIRVFLETGEIVQTCRRDGVAVACDCADAAVCGPEL